MMLDEMQHRIANSLQIIASIIMLKAKTVESDDARRHLHDAHKRVISVAAVQRHLHASVAAGSPGAVDVKSYLTTLCEALGTSMIGEGRGISLIMRGQGGSVLRRDAESIGLITTELVINSLKHAFREDSKDSEIIVGFDVSGTDWTLSVADNGVGISKLDGVFGEPKSGLGTGIISALAKQLNARLETMSSPAGTTVSITHSTFRAQKARAA
jgi:chemotaxis protein methyltransferase CheR